MHVVVQKKLIQIQRVGPFSKLNRDESELLLFASFFGIPSRLSASFVKHRLFIINGNKSSRKFLLCLLGNSFFYILNKYCNYCTPIFPLQSRVIFMRYSCMVRTGLYLSCIYLALVSSKSIISTDHSFNQKSFSPWLLPRIFQLTILCALRISPLTSDHEYN